MIPIQTRSRAAEINTSLTSAHSPGPSIGSLNPRVTRLTSALEDASNPNATMAMGRENVLLQKAHHCR